MSLPMALICICIALVVVLLVGEWKQLPVVRAISKTGASLAFIAFAIAAGGADSLLSGKVIVVGLVLSAVGDVALLSRKEQLFRLGLVAFLLAHVAYVAAFWLYGAHALVALVAAVPLGAVAWGVYRWLAEGLGTLRRPVIAYIAVITCMVASAVAMAASGAEGWRLGLLAAAVTFYLSDLCVARDRFLAPGVDNRLVGLPLYYGAQLLFGFFAAAAR